MIRLTLYITLLLALSLAGSWLIAHDGTITMTWLGYEIHASVMLILAAITTVITLTAIIFFSIFKIHFLVHRTRAYYREKRNLTSAHYFMDGVAALAGGDRKKAKALLRHDSLSQLPLAALLQAQLARGDGDSHAATDYYSSMLPFENTKLIALRGLAMQAYTGKHYPEALVLAEKAYKINPDIAWVVEMLADLYQSLGRLGDAEALLTRATKQKILPTPDVKRRMAALLSVRSKESPEDALFFAERAYKTLPSPDHALLLAKQFMQHDKHWRAIRLIKQQWEIAPSAELASLFASLYADATAEKKLRKIEGLAAVNPNHSASYLAVAEAAIAAGELTKARENLHQALAIEESKAACMLMAELEKRAYSEPEDVEMWLRRALKTESPSVIKKEDPHSLHLLPELELADY